MGWTFGNMQEVHWRQKPNFKRYTAADWYICLTSTNRVALFKILSRHCVCTCCDIECSASMLNCFVRLFYLKVLQVPNDLNYFAKWVSKSKCAGRTMHKYLWHFQVEIGSLWDREYTAGTNVITFLLETHIQLESVTFYMHHMRS